MSKGSKNGGTGCQACTGCLRPQTGIDMYDICLELTEHPENLALVGEVLGAGGVNINGLSLVKLAGRILFTWW